MDENLIARGASGEIVCSFGSQQLKDRFLKGLETMALRSQLLVQEGYSCGHCAAYPCFRTTEPDVYLFLKEMGTNPERLEIQKQRVLQEATQPVGLCFQPTRRCRQECSNYGYPGNSPASGGTCRLDSRNVKYEESCHNQQILKKFRIESLFEQ